MKTNVKEKSSLSIEFGLNTQVSQLVPKLYEISDELIKVLAKSKRIRVNRWVSISPKYEEVWEYIIFFKKMGVSLYSEIQPLNLQSPFAKCILAGYVICPFENQEDNTVRYE